MMEQVKNFLNSLNTTQKGLVIAIMSVVIYVVSAGVSFSIFQALILKGVPLDLKTALPGPASPVEEDPSAPKTESCPLDGSMHTKQARQAWELRRPLAVMVENHVESRPQSGLTAANVIYEAVAEGGITRFVAVYLCNLSDVQIGPVRSARTYFLDWISEYDALYAHVGGANTPGPANALGQIIEYKIKALNQFGIGFPTFWRDYQRLGRPVATEHTMYSTTQKLWEIGAKRGWTASDSANIRWDAKFVPWKFKDPSASPSIPRSSGPRGSGQGETGETVTKISVPFWESQTAYTVEWNYDSSCNCYKRKHGEDHLDLNNKQQLAPKNVVVQFQVETHANDGYENNVHLLYGNKGTGKALIFIDGKVIKGKWIKPNRLAREKFVDEQNREIVFNKGQIWIQTVPEGNQVTY